jgi:hypothetical protein
MERPKIRGDGMYANKRSITSCSPSAKVLSISVTDLSVTISIGI